SAFFSVLLIFVQSGNGNDRLSMTSKCKPSAPPQISDSTKSEGRVTRQFERFMQLDVSRNRMAQGGDDLLRTDYCEVDWAGGNSPGAARISGPGAAAFRSGCGPEMKNGSGLCLFLFSFWLRLRALARRSLVRRRLVGGLKHDEARRKHLSPVFVK